MIRFIAIIIIFFSCNAHEAKDNYFSAINKNDIKLTTPLPGEWRQAHNETLQTFDDYKKLHPHEAELGKTKIYLIALGEFSESQSKVLQLTKEYLEIFFQLKTHFLDTVSDKIIPDSAKRMNTYTSAVQLYTPYIFEHLLKGKMPSDGCALMAISKKDLYPSPDWNFVFGIASYKDRIGVSSIYRYQDAGVNNSTQLLKRLIGTASHEIGHMFSLHHCLSAKCCMNGSNSLEESDKQPLRLCSECQQKLQWNIKYDNTKRLKELIDFLKQHNLTEDLFDVEKDNKSIH